MEAYSLTCDSTTDVCPGTEMTCTCSVASVALTWTLPGSVTIAFSGADGVGSSKTGTNGVFFAVITDDSGGGKKSMLRNEVIQCQDAVNGDHSSINITFAG